MGKNYVESSLKRFLKRKVKITLGLVVTFLITGMAVFAVENNGEDIKEKLEKENTKIEEIEKNLQGLGDTYLTEKTGNNSYQIKKDNQGEDKAIEVSNNTIDFSNVISGLSIEIKDKNLTAETKKNIENALKKGNYVSTNIDDNKNEGIIITSILGTSQTLKTKGNTLENSGILIGGQMTGVNGTILNTGLIYVNRGSNNYFGGQRIASTEGIATGNIEVINNGLIIAKDMASGQYAYYTGNAETALINNGIINSEKYGQYFRQGQGNLYNYGVIEAKEYGQYSQQDKGVLYNYGTIDVSEKITGTKTGVGQVGEILYNYGLIKVTDGLAMKGTNYNFGVIKSSGNSKVFDGTTESKGIVISEKTDSLLEQDWAKDTAVFKWTGDNNYTLVNGENLANKTTVTNESFGNKTIGAIVNGTAKIEGIIENKNIASIVTGDKENTTVFTSVGDELVLKDTNITGYFENEAGGTVLDATASDLTLVGNTNVTAIKDQQNVAGNVVAVKLGKDKNLTLIGSGININGKIEGLENSKVNAYIFQNEIEVDNTDLELSNIENPSQGYVEKMNYTDTTIKSGSEINNLTFDFSNTAEGKTNKVIVEERTTVDSFTDNTSEVVKVEIELKDVENFMSNLNELNLGAGENTLTVNNSQTATLKDKTINLGTGADDTFVIKHNSRDENEFQYNVKNAETVVLSSGIWSIGKNGSISFDETAKSGNTPHINMADSATLNITLNQKGSDLSEILEAGKVTNGEHLVLSTDDSSKIKYIISDEGIKSNSISTDTYSIDKNANVVAPIFNVTQTGNNGVQITVKTAEEAGVGQYKPVYDAFIGAITNGNANQNVINKINGMTSNEDIGKLINNTNIAATAYYTAGTVVTKNITDSYLSAVENFGRRAGKGEWIAEGKFINSDTEFDGGSKVRGYEGDINSAVGMVEYGVSDTTSYGVVLGGGETEVDINGGGKLDGDNYYVGAYMKHRTANGVDVVANVGFVKSDLDSKLSNDFKLSQKDIYTGNTIDISGNSLVDGTADSDALAISLRGRKDFYITDSVKLQPNLGARVVLISQDEASNPEMGFEVKAQDIFVVEGIAGLDVAKEIAFADGKLELRAGAEYTASNSNQDHDAEYTLYGEEIPLEDSEIASTVGNAHIGFDYEHENGIGFNGKYEMMWSDEGDDSRITAGVSYRF